MMYTYVCVCVCIYVMNELYITYRDSITKYKTLCYQ